MRQERDGLSAAGETATKAKMKRRELRNVEDELEDLLKPRNPKLDNLLGTRGGGAPCLKSSSPCSLYVSLVRHV